MIDNAAEITQKIVDAGKMLIIPAPVIVFTKQDAIRAARMAPVVEEADHENVILVHALATPDDVQKRIAHFIVIQHAKNMLTGAMKTHGPWKVNNIPVVTTDEKHVFNLDWPIDK